MSKQDHKITQRYQRVTHAQIGGIEAHGKREGDPKNCDPERRHLNEYLVGHEDLRDIVNARIAEMQHDNIERKIASAKRRRRRREKEKLEEMKREAGNDPYKLAKVIGWPWDPKNSKPFVEGILQFSRSWYEDSNGEIDMSQVDRFKEFAVSFLRNEFGDELLYARLDLDETTPHVSFVMAPEHQNPRSGRRELTHKRHRVFGKREYQKIFEDDDDTDVEVVGSYELLQDRVADAAKKAGLDVVRGERRAAQNRMRQKLGEEVLRKENVPPQNARQLVVQKLDGASETSKKAERNQRKTEQALAEAQKARMAAEQDAEAARLAKREAQEDGKKLKKELAEARRAQERSEAFEQALIAGHDAVLDRRLDYKPAKGKEPEGLQDGKKASSDPAERKRLWDLVQPAYRQVTSFARRVYRLRQKQENVRRETAKLKSWGASLKWVQDRIPHVLGHLSSAILDAPPSKWDEAAFPDAFVRHEDEHPDHVQKRLDALSNLELARTYRVNEDAVELIDKDPALRAHFQDGADLLRAAAEARGFDIETRRHDPDKATDPSRARLHTDEERPPKTSKGSHPQHQNVLARPGH